WPPRPSAGSCCRSPNCTTSCSRTWNSGARATSTTAPSSGPTTRRAGEAEMEYRTLGRTGLRVSAVAFGAGPVSGLMTGDDHAAQRATVERAVTRGVNWIDTAPGYGQGKSEANLGRVLADFDAEEDLYVAT